MTRTLFFDTETTGFPARSKPLDSPAQPRLVQLAYMLHSTDHGWLSMASLIVSAGVPVPKQASDVHGLTLATTDAYGVRETGAVALFSHALARCDVLVAHNLAFDLHIMRSAFARSEEDDKLLDRPMHFCTMEKAKPVAKIPPTKKMVASGRTGFKSPNLAECVRHFFNEELEGAHDAFNDVRACSRVYFALTERL
jgi:DNA polymerase-3 subunit epsilon